MADHSEQVAAEQRLRDAANKLHEMVPDVAKARQIKEFSSDQRKNVLARYMSPLLATMSAAGAESTARADAKYIAEMEDQLGQSYRWAEQVIAKWQATQATLEAARTIVSLQKEQMRQLE